MTTKLPRYLHGSVYICMADDVSALEAENERMREVIKTALVDIAELEAILNREQEKHE